MENKISCRSGRTKVIDPNSFQGQLSSSNIPVQLEDLNISIQLETYKKGRSVLSAQSNGSSNGNTVESNKTLKVKFIEGTTLPSGEKSLTTKFTELTTIFEENNPNNDNESLGITSIDIDFNSSYAPLVTINFVDVRGSSIFQNDENIKSGLNKYSTFFELPYPLYQLTIKGYYGKPVKYCLHMTKFNSKFNSKTGNFEITASFIGYTYAMLSDMLMGYLKVIPYTTEGKNIYNTKNVLTLNNFITRLSNINEDIEKTSSLSDNSKAINDIDEKLSILSQIEQAILVLGSNLEKNSFEFNIRDKYPIIVRSDVSVVVSTGTTNQQTAEQDLLRVPQDITDLSLSSEQRVRFNAPDQAIIDNNETPQIDKSFIDTELETYENNVTKLVEQYTKISNQPFLDLNAFLPQTPEHFFKNLTKNEFEETLRTKETDEILKEKIKSAPNSNLNEDYTVFDFKVKQYSEILFRDYTDLPNDKKFSVHDMTYAYESIDNTRELLNANKEKFLKQLASEIDINISNNLGVTPTVRNVVEIFTTAVEAFIKTIFRVSLEAEQNTERKTELLKIFGNDSTKSDLINNDTIYAWPDYVEKTELGYVEKYLGSVKSLNTTKITELRFIDELLAAFIKGEEDLQNQFNETNKEYTNWIPINPLDSKIFVSESPYDRLKNDKSNINMVLATMLTRAMLFINYTNTNLTEQEILQMATFEANLISKLPDATLKSVIANKSVEDILKTTVDINSQAVKVIEPIGVNYYYNLLFNNNLETKKLLPISFKPLNDWDQTKIYSSSETNNYFNSGSLFRQKTDTFLTNYNPSLYLENDGGIHVQILSKLQYEKQKLNLIEEVNTESVILLDKIKTQSQEEISNLTANLSSAGFNTFGGIYGIQEFSKMDYGNLEQNGGDLTGLPLMYVFYGNSFLADNRLSNNGLNYNNLNIAVKTDFEFPITGNQNSVVNVIDESENYYDVRKKEFTDFGKNRNNFNKIIKKSDNFIAYPFVNQEVWVKQTPKYYFENKSFSLFGSLWYYSQKVEASKAFLFLNSLPFNNTLLPRNLYLYTDSQTNDIQTQFFENVTIESPEILRLFDQKSGFIKAPRLWVAYVGGILWRAEQPSDIIVWQETFNNETVFTCPAINSTSTIPSTEEYIKNITPSQTIKKVNIKVNPILLSLPKQVKEEFKRVFFDFVTGADSTVYTSWPTLKNKLEIWGGTAQEFKTTLDFMYYNIEEGQFNKGNFFQFKNLENYNIVTLNKENEDTDYKYTMILELYGNYNSISRINNNEISASKLIIDAMMEEVVIANNNHKIWKNSTSETYENIVVSSDNLTKYVNQVKSILANQFENPTTQKANIEQQIFGTNNQEVIKLQLYRTCKNIYDKWIGGVTNEDQLIYQCGETSTTSRRSIDDKLANALGKEPNSLISSFRFVSRSFVDIGDKFYINPIPIVDLIRNNPNASFYDVVSGLLADNYFDFVALPTYIDYTNELELSKLFQPYPNYEQAIDEGVCGPSFICVYVGQKSKNLDFNKSEDSYYANDGFDIRCLESSINDADLPQDFTTTQADYEDPVSVFAVNYSQQNQNIFKDITLDQSEFTETAESLKITDDIANKGLQNNVTLAGQNIYNVYSVRSYKAEIEMMGNAMIQPMMYFQLNNIPMFHGAYMITHVKHAIKPNNMSTNFTGVRIKKAETPLLTASDLYMSLLEGLDLNVVNSSRSGGNGGNTSVNYITKYYNDLVISLSTNTIIDGSIIPNKLELTNRATQEIANWQNGRLKENDAVDLLDVYAQITPGFSGKDFASDRTPWSAAFISYIMLAGDPDFPKSNQHYQYVTSAMKGQNGYEAFPLYSGLSIKAEVGDLFCKKRAGSYTNSHCDAIYKVENNTAYLVGGNISNTIFTDEITLVNGSITDDVKTSYQILVKKTNNKYYEGKNLLNAGVVLSTSYDNVPTGLNADYWSLIAVCSLENSTDQGRCDVAQSIYNRLLSGIYKGKSIKELVIADKQYEPVGRAKNEFRAINSKETAIKAFMKSKNVNYDVAKNAIEKTETALNNATLVLNSKNFIGGRTDFYSTVLKNKEPYKTNLANSGIATVTRDNQIFGCFVGPAAIKYGNTNPPAAEKPNFENVT